MSVLRIVLVAPIQSHRQIDTIVDARIGFDVASPAQRDIGAQPCTRIDLTPICDLRASVDKRSWECQHKRTSRVEKVPICAKRRGSAT
jgi:hypothetical protein